MTDNRPTQELTRFRVSAEAIAAYAELTNDFNPIHLDDAFAAQTIMGRVIAHGTLCLNLMLDELAARLPQGSMANARIEARFTAPVWRDETVTIEWAPQTAQDAGYILRAVRADGVEAIRASVWTPASAAAG